MGTDSFVNWQFGMTLLVVLAIAAFMLMRVRKSQARRGEEPGQVDITRTDGTGTTGTGPREPRP